MLDCSSSWVNGLYPPDYIADGQYCGSESAWENGGTVGIDDELTFLFNGQSTCCRSDTDFLLQEDLYFIDQEDGSKLIWT